MMLAMCPGNAIFSMRWKPWDFNYPCCLSSEERADVDREKRFHSRHLSRCLTSSRGKTPACGMCQRFVYFDEFRARQNRMSPLRRPERRNQLSLVLASLDTRRYPELSLQNASLQMQIAPRTHFFSASRHVNEQENAFRSRGGLLA